MNIFSEFFLLFILFVTTIFSTFFCIIGLSTPGWYFDNYCNLFCDQCPKTPSSLAIISMILLIICIILLALLIARIIDQQQIFLIRFIIPSLLILSTIFLLIALTSYLNFINPNHGYSYYLSIISFLFSYIASLLAVFWLGTGGFLSKTYSVDIFIENR
ncbi:unnamed protein product [Adineta steineri]|uniref:Uncharacterized protein n=1 Tax=Adineta steineri TaxID=433720 RepID=A0A818XC29_9BILA|nr:unnamed protein product [Adineta steineri]CAF3736654.1 unnamed protein product [Adineta steineri]